MNQEADSTITPVLHPQKRLWVEPATALVMALATLSTAWCSYQAAAFTRRANRLMNDYNALERRAALVTLQGMQTATIHTAMFMQMLAAQQAGNEKLAGFYIDRFPPDVRGAYDAWIAQKPFENKQAAPHPFVPELYELRGSREIAELSESAQKSLHDSRYAGEVSSQYLADTVLFATVLFFANASTKFDQRRVRLTAAVFALSVFAFAAVRLFLLPR